MGILNELEQYVMESVESKGEREEQIMYIQDVMDHGCISGTVTELISYHDTHEFFDKYYNDIMELVEEYELNTGMPVWSHTKGDLKNYLAWFGYEQTVQNLYGEEIF